MMHPLGFGVKVDEIIMTSARETLVGIAYVDAKLSIEMAASMAPF
jgi:hypothetical protein